MIRRLLEILAGRHQVDQRLHDARKAVRVASAAWADARARGDTRGQHTAWHAYKDAKTALLRVEMGL